MKQVIPSQLKRGIFSSRLFIRSIPKACATRLVKDGDDESDGYFSSGWAITDFEAACINLVEVLSTCSCSTLECEVNVEGNREVGSFEDSWRYDTLSNDAMLMVFRSYGSKYKRKI